MTSKKTGGTAFPLHPDERNVLRYGMTLRDYFAAEALNGKLASGSTGYNDIAEYAYKYADAMLKAREQ